MSFPSPLFPSVFFTDSKIDDEALSPILKPIKAASSPTNRTDGPFLVDSFTVPSARTRTISEPFHKKQFESIRVGVIAMDKKMKSKAMAVRLTLVFLNVDSLKNITHKNTNDLLKAILMRMDDFTLFKIGTEMLTLGSIWDARGTTKPDMDWSLDKAEKAFWANHESF